MAERTRVLRGSRDAHIVCSSGEQWSEQWAGHIRNAGIGLDVFCRARISRRICRVVELADHRAVDFVDAGVRVPRARLLITRSRERGVERNAARGAADVCAAAVLARVCDRFGDCGAAVLHMARAQAQPPARFQTSCAGAYAARNDARRCHPANRSGQDRETTADVQSPRGRRRDVGIQLRHGRHRRGSSHGIPTRLPESAHAAPQTVRLGHGTRRRWHQVRAHGRHKASARALRR
mmetsp:Transcript_12602/g.33936  ORF Transcript_12602/g.33936 Transcript_12602/m.33936 type:complete len:236 (+) Transcript_12602:2642-3349(+)